MIMKKYFVRLSILILALFLSININATKHILWYDKPARLWTEALPLGNGRLGAMIFGNPTIEQIQLNEETIWAGRPNNNPNPNALEYIPIIRDMVFAGQYLDAQNLATEKVMSNTNHGMPYQPYGDLRITFPGHNDYTDYYRQLDIDSAVATITYKVDGVNYKREYITSFSDNVVTIKLTSDKKKSISFNAQLTSPHQDLKIVTGDDYISLASTSTTHEKLGGRVNFQGRTSVKANGGRTEYKDGVVSVVDADEVIIYVSIATNFVSYKDLTGDEEQRVEEYLTKAKSRNYDESKKEHIDIYKSYFDRVDLYLGEDVNSHIPTDIRVENFKNTNDSHLVSTYFQFGRYLLIATSQPGCQPPNLQGIWNDKLLPSWDSKYTCNINVEMNYWPAEITNLQDLNEPLFKLIKEVSETGRETARVMYGVDGWVLHHNTDIWRITGPVDGAASGMWPSGGAWLCRHLWEHYLHTGDVEFLKEIYPIIRGSAEFFDNVMVYEPENNWLVVCPSNSPENVHAGSGGKATIAAGCTMDNQLIFDLWHSVIESSEILNIDKEFAQRLHKRLDEMQPMQVGRWGQLQEWMYDWDNPEDKHRHVSHLYGLYPSNQISPYRTPELFSAARTSLIHRGDPSTGWSMGWKVCLWARLLDGDHAYKLITDQLTLVRDQPKQGGTYPNLFDAHPPFQIDGNFGCTAGIAEMFLQSHDEFIYILPALPTIWKDGYVNGLLARGGFEFDIKWDNGEISEITLLSKNGGNCRLRSVTELRGKGLKKAKGENSNNLFKVPSTPDPIINTSEKLPETGIADTWLYDLKTEKGKKYTLYKK